MFGGRKGKGTETWRSAVGTVSPPAAPRRRSCRSARGPRAPRPAVALAAGGALGDPAARRRRRTGAAGVPALPAEVPRPRSQRSLAPGSCVVGPSLTGPAQVSRHHRPAYASRASGPRRSRAGASRRRAAEGWPSALAGGRSPEPAGCRAKRLRPEGLVRIASVQGRGPASAVGVGREPGYRALARPAGRRALAAGVERRVGGSCGGGGARAEAGAAGESRTFPPLPDRGRCLGLLCWG